MQSYSKQLVKVPTCCYMYVHLLNGRFCPSLNLKDEIKCSLINRTRVNTNKRKTISAIKLWQMLEAQLPSSLPWASLPLPLASWVRYPRGLPNSLHSSELSCTCALEEPAVRHKKVTAAPTSKMTVSEIRSPAKNWPREKHCWTPWIEKYLFVKNQQLQYLKQLIFSF